MLFIRKQICLTTFVKCCKVQNVLVEAVALCKEYVCTISAGVFSLGVCANWRQCYVWRQNVLSYHVGWFYKLYFGWWLCNDVRMWMMREAVLIGCRWEDWAVWLVVAGRLNILCRAVIWCSAGVFSLLDATSAAARLVSLCIACFSHRLYSLV